MLSPFELATLADGSVVHGYANVPAMLVVLAITAVIIRGTSGLAWFNALVALKVAVVVVFIALGWKYIDPANYHPFIPANTSKSGEFGWSGVLRGAGVIFFVFIGFDIVATMAQETKNPQRNMPIGILGSLVVCTIFSCCLATCSRAWPIIPSSKIAPRRWPSLSKKRLMPGSAEPLFWPFSSATPR